MRTSAVDEVLFLLIHVVDITNSSVPQSVSSVTLYTLSQKDASEIRSELCQILTT